MANITVKNAEPFDSIVDGARALQQQASGASSEEASIYSIPSSSETDNALTEYTVVKEIKNSISDRQKRVNNPPESEMDIYSAASTLSLGETVILSDGWLNHEQILPSLTTPNNTTTTEEDEDSHNIVLTLDVDTSASVI